MKRNKLALCVLLLPSLLGFTVFYLGPFIGGFYYSLLDSPVNGKFIWLKNFKDLLVNESFIKAVKNTLAFTGISVPLIMAASLMLGVMMCRSIPFENFFKTAFIIPLTIPVASVVFVWQIVFNMNGLLNGILHGMGFGNVDWMNSERARWVVVILYLWKNIGYNMVIFIAGLKSIPDEYYEAASIDGAGAWTKFRHITLVYITPTAFFVFIMSVINSFKVFRETYLISGKYPHDSIYMLQHYMNNMFINLNYQKLTSAAFVMAGVIVLLVLILFVAERKLSKDLV